MKRSTPSRSTPAAGPTWRAKPTGPACSPPRPARSRRPGPAARTRSSACWPPMARNSNTPRTWAARPGGAKLDVARSIAITSSGDAVLAGYTEATDFPTTASAFDSTLNGGSDAFVAVVRPAGAGAADLIYSTFLGGSGNDNARNVKVGHNGRIYLTGVAAAGATPLPTTAGAYDTTPNGGNDAFLAVFDPAQSGAASLTYASFFGDALNEEGNAVAVDFLGRAYIAGSTASVAFPVTVDAYQATNDGGTDAFLLWLDPQGGGSSDLLYSDLPRRLRAGHRLRLGHQ